MLEPPSVPGIGTGGGLKLYVQDRAGRGSPALEGAAWIVAGRPTQTPGFVQAFTLFNTRTPQIYADIDRTKAEQLGVPIARVFEALSVYMGSAFVNDFNILGRTYRVTAQADNALPPVLARRRQPKTRNSRRHGAARLGRDVPRHRPALIACRATICIPAAEVQWRWRRGFSTGQGIAAMENIAAESCRTGFGFEWTEIALQEKLAGNTAASRLRARRCVRIPVAGGALRELAVAARRHPHRARCVFSPP